MNMNDKKISKDISKALRHCPEQFHIVIDEYGWTDIEPLLKALEAVHGVLTEDDIQGIIDRSEKKRYEIKDHRIRAFYGHTLKKKIKKEVTMPPEILYHGTARNIVPTIMKDGIKSMKRNYVHLSTHIETAVQVGKRKDRQPQILKIHALQAYQDGINFYIGNQDTWLSDHIPAKYIEE